MNHTNERTLAEQLAANPELRIENPPRAGDPWSRYEDEILRRLYSTRDVPNLSWVLGRSPGAIRDRLKTLGLTSAPAQSRQQPKAQRAPQGKQGKVNAAGTLVQHAQARARNGKRADLGGKFFRSSWEANYARYLNWLMTNGQVKSWEYEPETFIFRGEVRGPIHYTPDFRVLYSDGRIEYVEIKGWNDPKSQSRHKKMAKYYPKVPLVILTQTQYRAIERQVAALIPEWENSAKRRSTR